MNAIILAAGLGGRMGTLTYTIPKPLLQVDKTPIIERQIIYLNEIGVREIYVVTGYMAGSFQYLQKKFNIELLYNSEFATCNNIYSLHIAKEHFGDSYILEGDVFLARNFLQKDLSISTYYTGAKASCLNEWILNFDDNRLLKNIITPPSQYHTGHSHYITTGVSYWTPDAAEILKATLAEKISSLSMDKNSNAKNLYWDNLVLEEIKRLKIAVQVIDTEDWYEIDTVQDYDSASTAICSKIPLL